jgi:hypothetical protein
MGNLPSRKLALNQPPILFNFAQVIPMPWDESDAYGKTHKANTPATRRQWAKIADKIHAQGGSDTCRHAILLLQCGIQMTRP